MTQPYLPAVIIAGGEGSRLKPLTENIPKPLVPIAGRPCILRITDWLRNNGMSELFITLGCKARLIRESFDAEGGKPPCLNEEEKPLGTAGALPLLRKALEESFSQMGCEDFFVIGGDCVCDFDLREAASFHIREHSVATVLLSRATDPREYGVAVVNNNRIVRFIEKPAWSRVYADTVNTGIYIFNKKIFDYIVPDGSGKCDFAKNVFPLLMEKGTEIHAFQASGYWKDIGDKASYLTANKDALAGKIRNIKPITKPFDNPKVIEPSYLGNNTVIGDTKIGPYAIIGDGCVIGNGCRVCSSVLLPGTVLEDRAEVRGAVICGNTVMRVNSSADEGSIIGENCDIGENSVISAGTELYGGNTVPPGVRASGTIRSYERESEPDNGTLTIRGDETDIKCLKAGNAFGRLIFKACKGAGKEPSVAVGTGCCGGDSRLFALIAGIISSGCGVYNTGLKGRSPLRFTIRKYALGGGICLSENSSGVEGSSPETVLTFYHCDGMPLPRDRERSLTRLYAEIPERAVSSGFVRQFSGFEMSYKKYIRVLTGENRSLKVQLSAPEAISECFTPSSDINAERIFIGDENITVYGESDSIGHRSVYPEETCQIVLSFVIGIMTGSVTIPYDRSFICDLLGKRFGYTVIRSTNEDAAREDLWYVTDAAVSGVLLLRYLAFKQMTFAQLCEIIPVHGSEIAEAPVEEAGIAGVMLSLIPDGDRGELVEGVKIFHPEKSATVLITPEKRKSAFRIYAEAVSGETAHELCEYYSKKISDKTKLRQ